MSKRILNFDDRVDKLLQELKQELKMPINKIITMIKNEKLEDIKRIKKETVEDLKMKDNQNEIEIRFRIFEKERIFLEQLQRKRTHNQKQQTYKIKYKKN